VEGVEKRLWELIKVNRRKAREGGGVRKGFFGGAQQKKEVGAGKKKKDEEAIEEISNPGLADESLDQKLKAEAEEAEKKAVSELAKSGDGKAGEEKVTDLPEEEADEGTGLVPNSGNGFTFENGQSWVQTLQDVTYTIPVPAGTKARDCNVDIRKTHLKVGLKSPNSSDSSFIIDDDLYKEIAVEDSFWNISKSCRPSPPPLPPHTPRVPQNVWRD